MEVWHNLLTNRIKNTLSARSQNIVTDDRSEIFKQHFCLQMFFAYDAVHDQLCQFHLTKNRGNFEFLHNLKTIFSLFFFYRLLVRILEGSRGAYKV